MAQVTVTIAGKAYRMACGDGEEERLESLAALLDGKISEMREAFGEIGDMRLQVMAAITLADDLTEARSRISALEAELADLRGLVEGQDERSQSGEERVAAAVTRAAERIERLARSLNQPPPGAGAGDAV